MSAAAERLLACLDHVQARGESRWLARCPAHDDGRPSLSVQATSDGTVLVHCFAGCSPGAVLEAVGLTLRDLFPEPLTHRGGARPRLSAHDVLLLLDRELLIVVAIASDLARGQTLDDTMRDRLDLVQRRLARVKEVVHGGR